MAVLLPLGSYAQLFRKVDATQDAHHNQVEQVEKSLKFLREETDHDFWSNLHKAIEEGLDPKDLVDAFNLKNVGKAGAALEVTVGGLMVAWSASSELAMKLYRVPSPMHAQWLLYREINGKLPRLAMKLVSPSSEIYTRMAARAATMEAIRQSAVSAGAGAFLRERLMMRLVGLAGGVLVGSGLVYLSMSSETAPPDMSEMPTDYYERPQSLVVMFETGATDEDILHVAHQQEGVRVNIVAMAMILKDLKARAAASH